MTKIGNAALLAEDAEHRRVLAWVLGVNLAQAAVVGLIGFLASSTGLIGAALDNLSDAGVYAVSLYAVGRSVQAQARAATLSGALLIGLSLGLIIEVLRRFFTGAEPAGIIMIATAIGNAAANVLVMRLLRGHRGEGAHFKASWIFTGNDVVANLGIVVSGIAILLLRTPLPDLVVGVVVAAIAMKGGWDILGVAREARRGARR